MPMHDLVTDHYRRLLAHRYEWMLGGAELQLQQAERLIEQLDLRPRAGGRVAELGGGPGFFAVALARGGFTVDLVDTSEFLLERARAHAQQLPVHTHAEDLVGFLSRTADRFELCACLGDTITHLPSRDAVRRMLELVRGRLDPGGRLIVTYRDLGSPREGLDRFLLVRADDDRIFTCFLESGVDDRVLVHDLVHEREGDGWTLHKSAYPKLILPRAWLVERLDELGFASEIEVLPSGLIRVVASVP